MLHPFIYHCRVELELTPQKVDAISVNRVSSLNKFFVKVVNCNSHAAYIYMAIHSLNIQKAGGLHGVA